MISRELRHSLETFIEAAIDLLDELDGDADAEVEEGLDQDVNPPSLNPQWHLPSKQVVGRRL